MKIVVWILSLLLAVVFVAVGGSKVLASAADLRQSAGGVPVALLRVAGTAEILGGLGLALPALTRILPVLTPIAAAGLTVTMTGATIANIAIGEYSVVPVTVVLGVLCALVCWARARRYAVLPRGRAAVATADAAS